MNSQSLLKGDGGPEGPGEWGERVAGSYNFARYLVRIRMSYWGVV